MAKETKSPLSSLLRMDLLVVLVVLFVPLIFFGDKALVIIIATLLIAASRASTWGGCWGSKYVSHAPGALCR